MWVSLVVFVVVVDGGVRKSSNELKLWRMGGCRYRLKGYTKSADAPVNDEKDGGTLR